MPSIESGILYLPSLSSLGAGTSPYALDGAADYISQMFQIPKTGDITGIKFSTATVTTGATLIATLETITDAKPSGTLYHANATGTVVVANTDDSVIKTVTFAGDVPATRGDFVCLKIAVSSGTPSALQMRFTTPLTGSSFPYSYRYIAATGTWWTGQLQATLTYDDGDMTPLGMFMMRYNASLAPSTTTSPDEVGAKIVAPYSGSVLGIYFRPALAQNIKDMDFVLYDSSDNVLATQSMSLEVFETSSTGVNYATINIIFDSNVDILKGRTYRVIAKPTSATASTGFLQTTLENVISWDGDANTIYTYRTDAGAWTDDSTRVVPIGLLVEKLYQPGGSYL